MSARDKIMGAVRKSLDAVDQNAARRDLALARLDQRPRHPSPERITDKTHAQLSTLFRSQLESVSATVEDAATAADVPELIADYLRNHNLPQRVRMGDDPRLTALDWNRAPTLELNSGRADPGDAVGVSHAIAAVAETGTLVLGAGADNPVTVTFLPETHIVLVSAGDLVGPYEDAFDKVRARYGANQMPRTVNMVSGPSRTGDIGGRLVMGAHGPRRLLVIVVGAGSDKGVE